MVGSAIYRQLSLAEDCQIITSDRDSVDLTRQTEVEEFLNDIRPEQIYLAAAKVGGIYSNNNQPAEFIYQNLMIEANIIHSAFQAGIKKILFLGSSCIYPKAATQPITESSLLSGFLEPTNEPYAIAKIAGVKLCESYNRQYKHTHGLDYRSIMPTNLYGPGDNYHPLNSHVIPGLINRFHNAKQNGERKVIVWGSGKPRREFLHVDDMAKASIFLMNIENKLLSAHTKEMCSHVNAGYGNDISIAKLAELIADVIEYKGEIVFDNSKPDGTLVKLMDSSLINNLGWKPTIELKTGLVSTYQDYITHLS